MENTFDLNLAMKMGVNIEDVVISQPDSADDAFKIIDNLIDSDIFDFICIDSVSALVPKSELSMGFENINSLSQSILLSNFCRKVVRKLAQKKCSLFFLNQQRVSFKKGLVQSGGYILDVYADMRIELTRLEDIVVNGLIIGHKVRFHFIHNKFNVLYTETDCELIYGEGFS